MKTSHGVLVALAALAAIRCAPAAGPRAFSAAATARAVAVAPQVDAAQLRSRIAALTAVRATETPEIWTYYPLPHTGLVSAEYVRQAFTAQGFTPITDTTDTDGAHVENVYVDIPGTQQPSEMVLLTGHHDAWYSGADDNASAISVMIEAARLLRNSHPGRTIRIVAFDREELGLIGASRYLLAHAADRIVMLMNMDCVAYASHARGSQSAPPGLAVRDTGDFLAVIGNAPAEAQVSQFVRLSAELPSPVNVVGLIGSSDWHTGATSDFLRSDHAPFWRAGIPALFLTDTAFLRNPNYHTATDTPDTLDYEFLDRSAALIVAATLAFASVD